MVAPDMKEIKECCDRINSLSKEMVTVKRRLNRLINERAKQRADQRVAQLRAAGEFEEGYSPPEGGRCLLTDIKSGMWSEAKMAMLWSFENVMAMYGNDTSE